MDYVQKFKILFMGGFTYLGLQVDQFSILAFLIAMDVLTGAMKHAIIHKNFQSSALIFGVVKKGSLALIPITMALMANGLNHEFNVDSILFVTMAAFIVGEGWSVIENVFTLYTGKDRDAANPMTFIIEQIQNKISKISEVILNSDSNK